LIRFTHGELHQWRSLRSTHSTGCSQVQSGSNSGLAEMAAMAELPSLIEIYEATISEFVVWGK
jgi:hypothetical protein